MNAGGEIDYQLIPERIVDNDITNERLVIRVFTKTRRLSAIERVFTRHRLYLPEPVDLSIDCPYYNF